MSPSWTVEQTSSVSPSWTVDQTPSGAGFLSFEKESSKLVQARTFSEEDTPRVVSVPVGPGEEKAAGIYIFCVAQRASGGADIVCVAQLEYRTDAVLGRMFIAQEGEY